MTLMRWRILNMSAPFPLEVPPVLKSAKRFHTAGVEPIILSECDRTNSIAKDTGNQLHNCNDLLLISLIDGQGIHPECSVTDKSFQSVLDELCL